MPTSRSSGGSVMRSTLMPRGRFFCNESCGTTATPSLAAARAVTVPGICAPQRTSNDTPSPAAASSTMARMLSVPEVMMTSGGSASPSRVRPTARAVRWNGDAPSRAPRSRACRLSADCEPRESSAARRRLPCSATSRKAFNSLGVTGMGQGRAGDAA